MTKDKNTAKKPAKPSIKDLQAQLQSLTEDLQRSHAEMVNYKRRTQEEKTVLMQTAKSSVVTDFIDVIDSFDRIVTNFPAELESSDWAKGVLVVARQLDGVLKKLGVDKIVAEKGTEFDPSLHEALMVDETEGSVEVIDEVIQQGYKIGDVVLRPTKVKVSYK